MEGEEVSLDQLAGFMEDAPQPLAANETTAAVREPTPAAHDIAHEDAPRSAQHKGKHRHGKRHRSKRHKRHRPRSPASSNSDDDDSDVSVHKRSKYVLDAAESGESGEDDFIDDDDEDNETEPGFEALQAETNNNTVEGLPPAPRRFLFHEGDEAMTAEELGREYEARAKALRAQTTQMKATRSRGVVAPSTRGMSSLRYTAHLLPQPSDPKVFAVKCRPRMTRLLVARIVNKCYAYRVGRNFERKRVDLGIISVFCLDHVKEYIYVEAYRKLFVEHALNGLEGLFRYNIAVVDPSELMQMMERRPSNAKMRVGNFVRLRQRPYRLDLAQVTEVHADGTHLTCKVVPREDFVGKPYNKPTTRLPPRFFAPHLAEDVEDCGTYYRWGELKFDKEGYLLKVVSTRMVIAGAQLEKPTTEELAGFFHNNREQIREAVARAADTSSSNASGFGSSLLPSSTSSAASSELRMGDLVQLVSGQLRGTIGTIVNLFTNNGTALLACQVPGQEAPVNLRVELSACVRSFTEGMHVIVEAGPHAGESGTVVRSFGETILLFPDHAASGAGTEFTVRANDCHPSKLVGSFGHSFGTWQLFDLVAMSDTNAVACIVRLNRNAVDVLTERNEKRTLTYAQIRAIGRATRRTTDRLQNPLTRGAEVAIQRTSLTPFNLGGQSGRIEQIFNRTLFVYCRGVSENAGIVALDASCVLLSSGRSTTRRIAPPKELPSQLRRPHHAQRADLSLTATQQPEKEEEWVHNSEWYDPSSTVP